MFCEKCGSQLKDDARFCSSCGKPIKEEKEVNSHQKEVSPVMSKKKTKGTGLIVFGVLLAIGGLIGAIYSINNISAMNNTARVWHGDLWLHRFAFGGCHHRGCNTCDELTMIIVVSIIALVIGVIFGICGITKMKNSKR